MKVLKYFLVSMVLLLVLTACSNPDSQEKKDFWEATLDVLEDKLSANGYDKGNWQIGVQDKSLADDEKNRSLTIRLINENDNKTETVMFSLQNEKGKKYISYIYKISEIDGDKQYDQSVDVSSIDTNYKNYEIEYTSQEFRYGNYFDGKEAKSKLTIDKDNQITYDNVPLLKETMEKCLNLIVQFQSEFKINYSDYNFVSLPELCKNVDIEEMNEISEETSLTNDYYGEPHINAKGYSLVDTLSVDKSSTTATFSVYNVERQGYDSNMNGTLEKREIENCYNLVMGYDAEVNYAIYFWQESAYMYLQSASDQEIETDVNQNGGANAKKILKTTNDSYQNVVIH